MGEVSYPLVGALLIGAIPGVVVGAKLGSRASDRVLRPVLVAVLLLTGLKLLGAPTVLIAGLFGLAIALGLLTALWNPLQRALRRHV